MSNVKMTIRVCDWCGNLLRQGQAWELFSTDEEGIRLDFDQPRCFDQFLEYHRMGEIKTPWDAKT